MGAERRNLNATVYPRACGGAPPVQSCPAWWRGLSPRVRGSLPRRALHLSQRGSIPARAGEPTCHSSQRFRSKVYPRACGGAESLQPLRRFLPGLSPRVRGNRLCALALSLLSWSIPARAGQPTTPMPAPRSASVYPRACGATRSPRLTLHKPAGLSPRVRGNPLRLVLGGRGQGSIPARAGQPPPPRCTHRKSQVYPRACGATASAFARA